MERDLRASPIQLSRTLQNAADTSLASLTVSIVHQLRRHYLQSRLILHQIIYPAPDSAGFLLGSA